MPVDVDYGSEYRYRDPIVSTNTLAIVITQSGETADTLAALREAKKKGARSIAICNVVGSMATRETDGTVYTHAGPGDRRRVDQGVHDAARRAAPAGDLSRPDSRHADAGRRAAAPRGADAAAAAASSRRSSASRSTEEIAKRFYQRSDFLYLGRGINYPIALEGALKLKEISYIHAEGYPAGEMKHGPIALIDEQMPVVDDRAARPRLREDDRQHPGGQGARRLGHRADDRGQRRRSSSLLDPAQDFLITVPDVAPAADAGADGRAAAAAGVSHRRPPRLRRRSAAESREERDGRIARQPRAVAVQEPFTASTPSAETIRLCVPAPAR